MYIQSNNPGISEVLSLMSFGTETSWQCMQPVAHKLPLLFPIPISTTNQRSDQTKADDEKFQEEEEQR